MKIELIKGKLAPNDKKVIITTTYDREIIKIFDLCIIINQISLNENYLRNHKGFNRPLFYEAIITALATKKDLLNDKEAQKTFCKNHNLTFEVVLNGINAVE